MNLIRYKSYSREEIHNLYSPDSKFVPGAGKWGLQGIVSVPNMKNDFIFFVTFGTTEAGHTFREGITEDGILTWQSKPGQKLTDPQINQLINHDHSKNNIYLLLRINSKNKYTYIGKLSYEIHNPEKEKPVQFQWQLLDWEIKNDLFKNIGLKLNDPESDADPFTPKLNFKVKNQLVKSDELPFPRKSKSSAKPGTRVVNVDFIQKAISSKDNGIKGELLVVGYEEKRLQELGINKKVVHVSLEGDGHGYDIESYNENGEKIFIEVKTTEGGKNNYFDVTKNEVLVSNEKDFYYYIYRLFNYNKEMNSAEFYILKGPISENFNLEASQYIASYRGENND